MIKNMLVYVTVLISTKCQHEKMVFPSTGLTGLNGDDDDDDDDDDRTLRTDTPKAVRKA